jgi:uncharacterized membrane protein YphA (DoxX/SURF4 family)
MSAGSTFARVLIVLVFLAAGTHKLLQPNEVIGEVIKATDNVEKMLSSAPLDTDDFFKLIKQNARLIVILIGVVEVGGAMLFIAPFSKGVGAVLLIGSLAVFNATSHQFWNLDGREAIIQQVMFVKNIGLIGGLLLGYIAH